MDFSGPKDSLHEIAKKCRKIKREIRAALSENTPYFLCICVTKLAAVKLLGYLKSHKRFAMNLTGKVTGSLPQVPVLQTLSSVWKGFADMASPEKLTKVIKKIGTHSGVFHCDEALACYMLRQLPEYQDAEIIRTREESILATCDVVVDVGGVYNPSTKRYDHHQRSFNETLSTILPHISEKSHIRLSSAGLVYVHHGMEVLSEMLKKKKVIVNSDCISKIYFNIYEGFIEELDAIDNGIPMYNQGHPKYKITTHLSQRVQRLNPEWNAVKPLHPDVLFIKAMEMVGAEFEDRLFEQATVWWPAREIVKEAILNRAKTHPSGKIIELTERCPWKEHLVDIEEELNIIGEIKFIIFHDNTDSWRVQGVPIQPDSFICRVFLHEDWMGVRDSQLSELAGIEDCIFCHSSGFIGGNKTKEGALKMALKSLAAVSDKD